jgi:hypothetical protein
MPVGILLGGQTQTDKREAIEKYRALYDGLNAIVCQLDLYGLSRHGEINDEFSDEVTRLLAALQHIKSESEVVDAVQRVFAASFSEHDFSRGACEQVGRRVFSSWQTQE